MVAAELRERCYDRFKSTIALVAEVGRLRSSVDTAAQVLWAACHGLVALRLGRPLIEWAPDEELMAAMLDSLFLGQIVEP